MKNKYIVGMILFITILVLGDGYKVYGYDVHFTKISNEDGLSQSTAEVIIQDKNGYIWIGTNDGLNKYNGYDFKIYRHNQRSKSSIANNYIVSLQEDSNGDIWVGTANGLSKIDIDTEKITNYFNGKESGNLSHNNIGDILMTKGGEIIVGTSDGLNLYNPKEDKFERILGGKEDLSSQYIRELEEDEHGNIWIGTKSGVDKLNTKNKKVYKYSIGEDVNETIKDDIYALLYDDGYMWIGTFKEGLNKINIETNEIKKYIHDPNDSKSIPSNFIREVYKDSNDTLWVGTDRGLSRINEGKEFITYKNESTNYNSVSQDNVFDIIEDKSGLIWVGTYSGISIFDPQNRIIHYKNNPNNKNSLSENIVHGIYEDEDELLWVGTRSKGINIINRKNGDVSHLNRENTNYTLSDNSINDITGKEDKIYIGTRSGLNIIDKNDNSVIVYDKSNGLKEDDIRTVFIDSKDNLWVGTPNGISIINIKTNDIINLDKVLEKSGIESLFAKVIYEDKSGVYWIGCFIDNGLISIDPKSKEIKNYKYDKNDKSSISSNTIRDINEDIYGNLWIGTSYGLNKLDKETGKFTTYTTQDGLSNDIVYGILNDYKGDLWLSTNSGISRLDIKTEKFENFGVTDGLQGGEFNGNASYKSKKEELIFGGINGLNIFHPDDINTEKYTPKVMFDNFEINGKKYNDINNMEFEHDENFINITLFLPDYRNTKNIQYYYMLEGTKEGWRKVESNDINYSNLDPGNYTLRVKARSYNGTITSENQVKFNIKPPFYKSNLAIFIYIIIFVFIIYYNVNRVNRLDNMVKKRTSQLRREMQKSNELLNKVIDLERRKNNYFINLSHELRTPLNVIYTTEQLITEFNKSQSGIEREKLSQYMMVMDRNTKRLLKLINNLIDTTKIEYGKYNLNLKENDIVYVVEEATLSLKEYVENNGIELIIDPEVEEKYIVCDASEIERCIVNLVGNAAKFTPRGGKIIITIKEHNDNVIITVEDTGIGIDKKYHESVFNRFNQVVDANSEVKGGSGLGLTITKQIIELHNGKIYLESEVNKGTKFTIIL